MERLLSPSGSGRSRQSRFLHPASTTSRNGTLGSRSVAARSGSPVSPTIVSEQSILMSRIATMPQAGTVIKPQEFRDSLLFLSTVGRKQFAVFKQRGKEDSLGIKGADVKAPRGSNRVEGSLAGRQVYVLPSREVSRAMTDAHAYALAELQAPAAKKAPSHDKLHTDLIEATIYTVSDIPSIAASIDVIANGEFADVGVQSGLKYTSGLSLLSGALVMRGSHKSMKESQAIGDAVGVTLDQIRLARGAVEFTTGGIMIGVRTVGLMATNTAAKTVAVWGAVLGIWSTVSASLLYALLAIPFAVKGIQCFRFLQEMNKIIDNKELSDVEMVQKVHELLYNQLKLTDEQFLEAMGKIAFETPAELYDMLKEPVVLGEDDDVVLSYEDKVMIDEVVEQRVRDLNLGRYDQITDMDNLKANLKVRYAKEIARMKKVKEAEFTRKCGTETLMKVREQMRLPPSERLVNKLDDPQALKEAMEIVKLAHDESKSNTILYGLIVLACVLGIASFIAATVFTGGLPLIIALATMLVMNFLMLGLDGYSFIAELQGLKNSGKKDKIMLVILAVISIVCAGVGAYFSSGMTALIVILAVGAIMLGILAAGMAWSYYRGKEIDDQRRYLPRGGGTTGGIGV